MPTELAVFRRCVVCGAGTVSFPDVFRDNQEKGPVSFRVGGGAGAANGKEGVTVVVVDDPPGLLAGDEPAGGDHGIEGSALAMLLSDKVLLFCCSVLLEVFVSIRHLSAILNTNLRSRRVCTLICGQGFVVEVDIVEV